MEFLTKSGAAFVIALVLTVPANAMNIGGTPDERQERIDKKLKKITHELRLTPDQQTSIRAAIETKMEKLSMVEDDFEKSVRSVLTPEQIQKFEKKLEKRR